MAMSKTVIDGSVGDPDAFDAKDITGNGLVDLLVGQENGVVYWYEQTSRGSFTKHTIRGSAVAGSKNEGGMWVDIKGDGNFQAVLCNQADGLLRVYEPNVAGDYDGTWSGADVFTGYGDPGGPQDCQAWDINGDGVTNIVFGSQKTTGGVYLGGIYWVKYNSGSLLNVSSYTVYTMTRIANAYWLVPRRLDISGNGEKTDIVFSCVNDNGEGTEGIYWLEPPEDVTQTWNRTTIMNETGFLWSHIDSGDFFGNGVDTDIVAINYGVSPKNSNLVLYDSSNNWAKTTVSSGNTSTHYNRHRFNVLRHVDRYNGRDKIVSFGGGVSGGTQGYTTVWQWNGTTWEVEEEFLSVKKADDRVLWADLGKSNLSILAVDSGSTDEVYYIDVSSSSTPGAASAKGASSIGGLTGIKF